MAPLWLSEGGDVGVGVGAAVATGETGDGALVAVGGTGDGAPAAV
jgi:hypothetical protein